MRRVITNEPCPVCQAPAECEHGLIVNGYPSHIWNCHQCAEHVGRIGYVCPDCERAKREQSAWRMMDKAQMLIEDAERYTEDH